jgi:periodic tryptophan protein 2
MSDSISQNDIDFVDINASGEWLAFGASKLGQLLVWEWQSESYILKQQGHFDSMNAIVYSPDGQKIITTADDGKIKVWDVNSGFCIVTFTEHTSGVTACEFAKRGNVLFTASLDGSIRAWDLIRYRNFRTFTAPTRLSFSSLAVDPSGEVICAGSLDSFDIHVWSVQTGALLDQLAGHEGPVSTMAFAPNGTTLASGSWDHTVRLWSIFARTQTSEPLQLQADVLSLAFSPSSTSIAIAALDGSLTFWSTTTASQSSGLDARRDVSGGRKASDRRTAANAAGTKAFSTLSYSADGSCVLAAGASKYICLYDVASGVLLKKFTVSINLDLSGTQEYLNSRNLLEAGPRELIDTSGEAADLQSRLDRSLPGSKRSGDASLRSTGPEVRVTGIAFSPTNRSFCAASTEGLLVYSLDATVAFDPFDLDVSVTPATITAAVKSKSYLRALVMAFRLNERKWLRFVYERVPVKEVDLVLRGLPDVYVPRLMAFVAREAEETPHVEVHLRWMEGMVTKFGRWIKEGARGSGGGVQAELRACERSVKRIGREIGKVAEENAFVLGYLLEGGSMAKGMRKEIGNGAMGGDEGNELTIEQLMNGNGTKHDEVMSDDEEDGGEEDGEGEWMGLDED